jgi:hypothetical protein
MDLPKHFGVTIDAQNRLSKWAADETWKKDFAALLAQGGRRRRPNWVVASSPPGARRTGPRPESDDHAPGRSRGGPTTRST